MPTGIAAEAKCDEALNLQSHMRSAVATNTPYRFSTLSAPSFKFAWIAFFDARNIGGPWCCRTQ